MKQENETATLTLPETLNIESVSQVMAELKKRPSESPLIVECAPLTHIDSAGVALVNYLKKYYPNAAFKNMNPGFKEAIAMFPSDVLTSGKHRSGLTARIRIKRFALRSWDLGVVTLGNKLIETRQQIKLFFVLLADEFFHTLRYLIHRRGVYPGEIWNQLHFMAYKSFPIVSLISFLVGVTISLTSAQQLRNFGADIYLADLVGFGMIRELAPLMTGIILSGKVGASITAEIASMKVLEETDAIRTMGISPEKFLMVPRLISISLAVPLLVAISDFVGIAGGMIVGKFFSGLPPVVFYNEMLTIVGIADFLIGLGKTLVFGWLVVISAGFKGFTVERSPTGVGEATTESVVLSISLIIGADCLFALLLY